MPATTEFPAHPFWDFALPLHETKGVGEACIALQDRLGVDVNCLLLCCWLGASGRGRLGDAGARKMIDVVRAWSKDVVQVLRGVRRFMRPGVPPVDKTLSDSLRRRILEVEIDCERAEIVTLGQSLDAPPRDGLPADARAGDAVANLGAYLGALGVKPEAEDCAGLAVILGAAVPGLPEGRAAALCRALAAP
jgi:uncharacterized protein (TIGR02444 family)